MTEKTTEKTAAEQLAEQAGTGAPETGPETAADGPETPAEGQDTGDAPEPETETPAEPETETPAEDDSKPLTKDDGTPFTAADLTALRGALRKARTEARTATKALSDLKAGGQVPDEVVAEAESAAEAKWRPMLVRSAARAALTGAGLNLPEGRESEAMARAVRLLDEDALTITDEGEVEGLAEQVDALRGDFPDLFAAAAGRARPRVQAGDRPTGPQPEPSAAERLAAQFAGR